MHAFPMWVADHRGGQPSSEVAGRSHRSLYRDSVRNIVRILAVALLAVLGVIAFGEWAPEGSFVNDLGDGLRDALRLRWFPSLAPGVG